MTRRISQIVLPMKYLFLISMPDIKGQATLKNVSLLSHDQLIKKYKTQGIFINNM